MAAEYYRPDRRASGRRGLNGSAARRANGHGVNAGGRGATEGAGTTSAGRTGLTCMRCRGNLCRCTGYRPIRTRLMRWARRRSGDPFLARLAEPAPAARGHHGHEHAGPLRAAARPGRGARAAGRPPGRAAGGRIHRLGRRAEHQARSRAALTIGIDRLEELREFSVGPDRIDLGAALSLSEIEARLAGRVPLLADLFPQFASRLIRNGATLGGNLGTASPIGDAPPALLALDASLVLASAEGEREVLLADYFTGYRQSVRRPGELIKTIRLPLPLAPVTAFHKIAKRRFDDISSVAVAYALTLDGDGAGRPGAAAGAAWPRSGSAWAGWRPRRCARWRPRRR